MIGRAAGDAIAGWLAVAGLLFAGASARGQVGAPADLSAAEVHSRWHSRLDGRHFTARLRLELRRAGMDETRELTVYRSDADARGERVLLRFDRPPDLRDVGLLYREATGRPNEYFLYTPSTRRVRRLPAALATEDLYGVDLEFLGFGTSEVQPTDLVGLDLALLEGRRVYRLAERARERGARFDERTTWIDPASFIPLQTELRRSGDLILVARTHVIRELGGVPTPVEMSFVHARQQRDVRLHVESADYQTPLGEEVFAILNLTRHRRDLARP